MFLVNNVKPVNRSASEQQFMDLLAYRPFTLFCNCSFIIRVINNFLIELVTCWMKLQKLLIFKIFKSDVSKKVKVLAKLSLNSRIQKVETWVKNAEKSCLWSSNAVYMCSYRNDHSLKLRKPNKTPIFLNKVSLIPNT